jgi:hypothetical protein
LEQPRLLDPLKPPIRFSLILKVILLCPKYSIYTDSSCKVRKYSHRFADSDSEKAKEAIYKGHRFTCAEVALTCATVLLLFDLAPAVEDALQEDEQTEQQVS